MEPGNKVKVPHCRDRRKKKKASGVSESIGGDGDQIGRDRRIKSPSVLPA